MLDRKNQLVFFEIKPWANAGKNAITFPITTDVLVTIEECQFLWF